MIMARNQIGVTTGSLGPNRSNDQTLWMSMRITTASRRPSIYVCIYITLHTHTTHPHPHCHRDRPPPPATTLPRLYTTCTQRESTERDRWWCFVACVCIQWVCVCVCCGWVVYVLQMLCVCVWCMSMEDVCVCIYIMCPYVYTWGRSRWGGDFRWGRWGYGLVIGEVGGRRWGIVTGEDGGQSLEMLTTDLSSSWATNSLVAGDGTKRGPLEWRVLPDGSRGRDDGGGSRGRDDGDG